MRDGRSGNVNSHGPTVSKGPYGNGVFVKTRTINAPVIVRPYSNRRKHIREPSRWKDSRIVPLPVPSARSHFNSRLHPILPRQLHMSSAGSESDPDWSSTDSDVDFVQQSGAQTTHTAAEFTPLDAAQAWTQGFDSMIRDASNREETERIRKHLPGYHAVMAQRSRAVGAEDGSETDHLCRAISLSTDGLLSSTLQPNHGSENTPFRRVLLTVNRIIDLNSYINAEQTAYSQRSGEEESDPKYQGRKLEIDTSYRNMVASTNNDEWQTRPQRRWGRELSELDGEISTTDRNDALNNLKEVLKYLQAYGDRSVASMRSETA